MTPQEFISLYLPYDWAERDLQLLIQSQIKKGGFLSAPAEQRIKTQATSRRSDLETWLTRYEIKRFLTYDNLFHALGQLYLYDAYGTKLLWLFPKFKCIAGIAPTDPEEYKAAKKLAVDIRGMGIRVWFVNESRPIFLEARLMIGAMLGGAIAAFTLSLILSHS